MAVVQAESRAETELRLQGRLALGLAVLVFASRLPFLRPGYGTDPDAYRVIAAARVIRSGDYTASRLPGYPLHELATALLLPGGPRLVNGATALMSALAAWALTRLGARFGLSAWRAALLGAAFAFTPVVYQNSTTSMDYLWAVCFALLAALQARSGRPLLAGLCLGLAIGARLTSGAMLLPLLLLVCWGELRPERRLRSAALLVVASSSVGALCFAPVVRRYGLAFFDYYSGPRTDPARVLALGTTHVWGSVGVYAWLLVAIALFVFRVRVRALLRGAPARLGVFVSVVTCALYLVAFLLLPHEAAYLIPLVPFALLPVALLLPSPILAGVGALLLLSSFTTLEAGNLAWPGPVPQERRARLDQMHAAERVIRAVDALPGKALIVAATRLPIIEEKLHGPQQGPHHYVYLLDAPGQLEQYRREGYAIYYTDRSVVRRQRQHCGLDLRALGAHSLL